MKHFKTLLQTVDAYSNNRLAVIERTLVDCNAYQLHARLTSSIVDIKSEIKACDNIQVRRRQSAHSDRQKPAIGVLYMQS